MESVPPIFIGSASSWPLNKANKAVSYGSYGPHVSKTWGSSIR